MHGHAAIVGALPFDAGSHDAYTERRAGAQAESGVVVNNVSRRRGAPIVAVAAMLGLVIGPLHTSTVAAGGRAARLMVGDLKLRPCPDVDGTWCGSIDRPLDAAIPSLGTIGIHFEWLPATGPSTGTLVAVEGGPGYAEHTEPRLLHRALRAALGRPRSVDRRQPRHRPVGGHRLPRAAERRGRLHQEHRQVRAATGRRRLGVRHRRRGRRHGRDHRAVAGGAGRSVRRFVRHVLRSGVQRAASRSAALGGARRCLPRAERRLPVRHRRPSLQPCDGRQLPALAHLRRAAEHCRRSAARVARHRAGHADHRHGLRRRRDRVRRRHRRARADRHHPRRGVRLWRVSRVRSGGASVPRARRRRAVAAAVGRAGRGGGVGPARVQRRPVRCRHVRRLPAAVRPDDVPRGPAEPARSEPRRRPGHGARCLRAVHDR